MAVQEINQVEQQQPKQSIQVDLHPIRWSKTAWSWSHTKTEAMLRAMFPEAKVQQKENKISRFFTGLMQFVLWGAFAAFLAASLPHVAYFFAAFEPENNNGQVDGYWWVVSYALAVAIDLTSFLLSLNMAVKIRHATAGLRGVPKIAATFGILVTHWPFILLLVGFSWLVNFEHAKEFHSTMLATAESVQVNLIFWSGTLGDLNPVISSAFPVLAVAYTVMSDHVSDDRQSEEIDSQEEKSTSTPVISTPVSTIQPLPAIDLDHRLQEMERRLLTHVDAVVEQSIAGIVDRVVDAATLSTSTQIDAMRTELKTTVTEISTSTRTVVQHALSMQQSTPAPLQGSTSPSIFLPEHRQSVDMQLILPPRFDDRHRQIVDAVDADSISTSTLASTSEIDKSELTPVQKSTRRPTQKSTPVSTSTNKQQQILAYLTAQKSKKQKPTSAEVMQKFQCSRDTALKYIDQVFGKRKDTYGRNVGKSF